MAGEPEFRDAHGRTWTAAESDAAFAELGDRVIAAWRRAARSDRRHRLERQLYSIGEVQLTPAQIDALEALVARPEWRMNEIAEELRVDPSTATRTFQPLLRLGLAELRPDELDRRSKLIGATDLGRRQSAEIVDARRVLMREVLARIAPERRLLFADLLVEWIDAQEAVAAERGLTPDAEGD